MEFVNFTCEWPNSQLDPPLVASLRRLVVNHSMASYVIRNDRKYVASHSWNLYLRQTFCRVRQVTRGGRAQVVGRSLIGRKALQVSRRSVASVSRRSGRGRDSGAWVYADRLTNGVRGSRARKSVVVLSQVALITWPVIHFFLLVCQSLPNIDVNASLRSNDKSLTTAQES